MKAGGSSTHGGINAQDWSAISLFLQYIVYVDFDYIGFEQPQLKDFNLVFTSGKKIICESKKMVVTYADVKEILDGVDENDMGERDEIIIICEGVSKEFKGDLEWYKYFKESKKRLEKKGFKESHFKLLKKLSFYQISREQSQKVAYGLFAKLLGMWIPEKSLQEMVDSIVIQKVYFGSEAGKKYSRRDFYNDIEYRKKEIIAESGYYCAEEGKIKQIEELYQSLKKPGHKKDWSVSAIKSLAGSPDIHYLTIKKLKEKNSLDLEIWDTLWKASVNSAFSFEVMDIFQKNSNSTVNQGYLVEFLPKIIGKIIDPYRERFYQVDIAKICKEILSNTRLYDAQIFLIIQQLLDNDLTSSLYTRTIQGERWEDEEICRVLKELFVKSELNKLKQAIVNFIFKKFNLIEDSGEYWHFAPREVFEILKIYANTNPAEKILEIKRLFVQQLDHAEKRKYGRKCKYKGQESWSFSGDRHFVTYVLEPVLTDYYNRNPLKAWKYILENCITRDIKKFSTEHPDFMNRIALTVLVKEYKEGKNKEDAFNVLSDFIKMPTIPTKSNLILDTANKLNLSNDDKWKLIEAQLNYPPFKGLPLEKTEEIVIQLASEGYAQAIEKVANWSQNVDYNKRKGFGGVNVIDTVPNLLKNSTQMKAIKIMKDYLNSDYFIKELDTFKVWKIAEMITDIFRSNYSEGKKIIEEIWNQKPLTENQQNVLSSVIGDIARDDTFIENIYLDILSKWLDECKDSLQEFRKIFPNANNRESFISFGEKMADLYLYDGVLRLAKLFIDDPSPTIINDVDDPKGESNLHEKIKNGEYVNSLSGVRARVCFLLEKVVILQGRNYIPEVISMVKKLVNDPNYFVRASACLVVERLMRFRNSFIPNAQHERFLSIETEEEICGIAKNLLNNEENQNIPQIMKNIVFVIDHFRTLNESDAIKIFKTIIKTNDKEAISEAMHIFLLYAEFRKDFFKKDLYKNMYGETKWKELNKYDGGKFKKLFIEYLRSKKILPRIKSHFAWMLWHLPKNIELEIGLKITYEYFPFLISEYSKDAYRSLYYFINDYNESHYKQCISLWKEAVKIEREYLEATLNEENFHELHWLPYHYNGKILCLILDNEGKYEFFRWLDYLLDYPQKVLIANDLNLVVDQLVSLPVNNGTKRLFDKLVTRQPQFFDTRMAWLEK